MNMRATVEELPILATFEMKVNGHLTKVELDQNCLDRLSWKVYGEDCMASERTLGLLAHGFLSQFIDCNEPPSKDRMDAAYQLGRRLGSADE